MKRIGCYLFGHRIKETGKRSLVLHQMVCVDCNGLFVMCEGQRGMLNWDWEFEWQFRKSHNSETSNAE